MLGNFTLRNKCNPLFFKFLGFFPGAMILLKGKKFIIFEIFQFFRFFILFFENLLS